MSHSTVYTVYSGSLIQKGLCKYYPAVHEHFNIDKIHHTFRLKVGILIFDHHSSKDFGKCKANPSEKSDVTAVRAPRKFTMFFCSVEKLLDIGLASSERHRVSSSIVQQGGFFSPIQDSIVTIIKALSKCVTLVSHC